MVRPSSRPTSLVVDRRVNQRGLDRAIIGAGVVNQRDGGDGFTVRPGDGDLADLVVQVGEFLDRGVELGAKARLHALENVIPGRLVPRRSEGAVTAVLLRDVV